jgi:hypothetical protein
VRVPITYTPEQVVAANEVWKVLLDKWKQQNIYITSFPFPSDGSLVSGKEKTVTNGSVITNGFKVVSNIFLSAESEESAIELAKTFPVLEYGGSVEIRKIQQRPPASV